MTTTYVTNNTGTGPTYDYTKVDIVSQIDNRIRNSRAVCPPIVAEFLVNRGWDMSGVPTDPSFSRDGKFFMLRWGEALAVENMLMFLELEA